MSKSQYTKNKIIWNNLALNAGSTKGISQVGALCYLEDNNLLDIKQYAGTSVGSMIATFHCAGCTGRDIWNFLKEIDLKKLFTPNIVKFVKKYGMDDGNLIEKIIDNTLELTFGKSNITFKELYQRTGKLLIMTGTNLTKKELEIYSVKKTPDMIVSKAVRISCSIPIMFEPIINENGDTLVDGAFMNNFPLDLLPIEKTIGIKIVPVLSTKYQYPEEYLLALLNLCQHCVISRTDDPRYDTIDIKFKEAHNAFDFSLDDEEKQKLFDMGYNAAKSYHKSLLETITDF